MVSFTSKKHYIGDTVHVLSIVNIIIFIGFLIANAKGFGINFSPAFAKDGFCVSNKDQHILLQSHAICFYEDTLFAILLWFLASHVGKGVIPDKEVSILNRSVIGCFIHGAAHMSVAYRDSGVGNESSGNLPFPVRVAFNFIFWLAMMNLVHEDFSLARKTGRAMFYNLIQIFFIPRLYNFAYVHCILLLEFSMKVLLAKEKDEFYNLKTVLLYAYLPNAVLGWVEMLACEDYLRPIGGHAIYDLAIPIVNIIYFWIIYLHHKAAKKSE